MRFMGTGNWRSLSRRRNVGGNKKSKQTRLFASLERPSYKEILLVK